MVNQAATVTWIGWNGYSSGSVPNSADASPTRPTSRASRTEYTVLVKNRFATRSMLPITRRPSPTT